jgi:hypothetical protein
MVDKKIIITDILIIILIITVAFLAKEQQTFNKKVDELGCNALSYRSGRNYSDIVRSPFEFNYTVTPMINQSG